VRRWGGGGEGPFGKMAKKVNVAVGDGGLDTKNVSTSKGRTVDRGGGWGNLNSIDPKKVGKKMRMRKRPCGARKGKRPVVTGRWMGEKVLD